MRLALAMNVVSRHGPALQSPVAPVDLEADHRSPTLEAPRHPSLRFNAPTFGAMFMKRKPAPAFLSLQAAPVDTNT
jgi:hypothetical protein